MIDKAVGNEYVGSGITNFRDINMSNLFRLDSPRPSGHNTLTDLVKDFKTHYGSRCDGEDIHYGSLPTLEAAIHDAAFGLGQEGKRSRHQARIPQSVLKQSFTILRRSKNAIRRCRSFHELWTLIGRSTEDIQGLGELYVYDTARRIGVKRKLYPTSVYLHRGTRDGARALKLDYRKSYISSSDLPRELRRLSAAKAEDFLCIYKKSLSPFRR